MDDEKSRVKWQIYHYFFLFHCPPWLDFLWCQVHYIIFYESRTPNNASPRTATATAHRLAIDNSKILYKTNRKLLTQFYLLINSSHPSIHPSSHPTTFHKLPPLTHTRHNFGFRNPPKYPNLEWLDVSSFLAKYSKPIILLFYKSRDERTATMTRKVVWWLHASFPHMRCEWVDWNKSDK